MIESGKKVVWNGGQAHIMDGVSAHVSFNDVYIRVGTRGIKLEKSPTEWGHLVVTSRDAVDLLAAVLDELADQGRLK